MKNYCIHYTANFILLLCSVAAFGQNFSLNINPTAATCATAGTLSFAVSNESPGIPVSYTVYLMPDIATPVIQTLNTSVSGLAPGNYYVVGAQHTPLGTITATNQAEVQDNSNLSFHIIDYTPLCPSGGSTSFHVEVTSGVAATYEIIAGPVTPPIQTSPDFGNIPTGYYGVRVTDICGNYVDQYTLIAEGFPFEVSAATIVSPTYPGCNQIETMLRLTSDPLAGGYSPIPYPLIVEYTIHSGGSELIIEQQLATGDPWQQEVWQVLPNAVLGELLDVDIVVHHPCGEVMYTVFGAPPGQPPIDVNPMTVTGGYGLAGCAQKYLTVAVTNLVLPYSIEFTDYPDGFDPTTANIGYPGPYTNTFLQFGNETTPVPIGFYNATVSDACGQVRDVLFTVTPAMDVEATSYNYDCINNLGAIVAQMVSEDAVVNLVNAVITSAPEEFDETLPRDVSEHIDDNHVLEVQDLPPGLYSLTFADECGNTLSRTVRVRENVPSVMIGDTRPDCTPGLGTVTITTHNPPLSAVKIMIAPPDFPYPLPYDVSFNINSQGVFYMDGLLEGDYRFLGADVCYNPDKPRYYSATVSGYKVTQDELSIVPGCNSYDITLDYTSNAPDETLWLQQQLPSGAWGHPETGQAYTEGAVPNATTGILIESGETFTATGWEGNYRILRHHQAYASLTGLKDCVGQIHDFELFQGLQLIETNILSCPGAPITLEVVTNAAAPASYSIIRRNGIPYLIQNGPDNIFTGLEAATYTLKVTDGCGRSLTVDIVTQEATPLIVVNDPGTLFTCDEANDGQDIFTLSQQTAGILGSQDPDEYTVTYHATQADADAGTGALPDSYTSAPGIIYARVVKNDTPGCYGTIGFALQLYPSPVLNMITPVAFCEGSTVTLTAPAGFAGYRWSNNVMTAQNVVGAAGDYTIIVTNEHGCESSQTITVVPSPVPEIERVDITDFAENNSIVVNLAANPAQLYPEYSLDGVNYQPGNTFENLGPGQYTVYVRDTFGCGFDRETVYLLDYPRFFTPNGDGSNDTWRIKFSTVAEPSLTVDIFNRFGKLIVSFNALSEGWDGTFNGAPLPADDYWFIVKRESGVEYKGHFSLLR